MRTLILLAAMSCTFALEPGGPNKRIIVIAHRAAHESAPENSVAAIRDAIRLGCDYVELMYVGRRTER